MIKFRTVLNRVVLMCAHVTCLPMSVAQINRLHGAAGVVTSVHLGSSEGIQFEKRGRGTASVQKDTPARVLSSNPRYLRLRSLVRTHSVHMCAPRAPHGLQARVLGVAVVEAALAVEVRAAHHGVD